MGQRSAPYDREGEREREKREGEKEREREREEERKREKVRGFRLLMIYSLPHPSSFLAVYPLEWLVFASFPAPWCV